MLRISNIVFVFLVALNHIGGDVPQKILLTVYYESQCPDSKNFIEDQLQPAINKFHNYLILKLVPFGKARSINNGYKYTGFECQHGPTECAGNMVQSCALDLMQERNDVEKVSYVACEMETEAGTRGDMRCVRKAGLHPSAVHNCVASGKGVSLQLNEEYNTNLVRPQFIPTITINGEFNQEVQDIGFRDLPGILCTILKDTPPCAEHYNSRAMLYVLL